MINFVELFISYQETTKILIYEKNLSLEEFLTQVKKEFKLNSSIKLLFNDAEITSAHSFCHGRKLLLEVIEESQNVPDVIQENKEHMGDRKEGINIEDIENVEFQSDVLLEKLNEWSQPQKFKLIKSEGTKAMSTGFFRTFICSEKECKFRLTFKSNKEGKFYKLDSNLAQKHCIHSKEVFFCLFLCYLDHQLNFDGK